MSSAAAAIAAEQVILKALEEAVSRIARKAAEGKRLSDREASVLMMSMMMRRMEDFRSYMDKRLEDFDKRLDAFDRRLDDLKVYVDRRLEDFKAYVDGRFDSVERRMEGLGAQAGRRLRRGLVHKDRHSQDDEGDAREGVQREEGLSRLPRPRA